MTQFVVIEAATRRIVSGWGRPDPEAYTGPSDWRPIPHDGLIYVFWQGRLALGDAPSPFHEYKWVGEWSGGAPQWVFAGTLDQYRELKATVISDACRASIERGFECAALGELYVYPAKAQDQANLLASVTDSLLAADDPDWTTPFWCADAAGVWAYRQHTAAQIRQVGREGKGAIVAAQQKNEDLQQQIATAVAEQLDYITW